MTKVLEVNQFLGNPGILQGQDDGIALKQGK